MEDPYTATDTKQQLIPGLGSPTARDTVGIRRSGQQSALHRDQSQWHTSRPVHTP